MKLRWLGHSAFRVETAKQTILIDPFLTHNPSFQGLDLKDAVKGVTHILLTHGPFPVKRGAHSPRAGIRIEAYGAAGLSLHFGKRFGRPS